MNYLFLSKIFARIFGFIFRRLEIIVKFVTFNQMMIYFTTNVCEL